MLISFILEQKNNGKSKLEDDWKFLIISISSITTIIYSCVFFYNYSNKKVEYIETNIKIFSLKNSNNNNNFYIGNYIIEDSDKYSIFMLNDNGSKKKLLIPTKNTDIFEKKNINSENAMLKKINCFYGDKFSNFLLIHTTDFNSCDFNARYELYVPEKTIIGGFKVE